MLFIPDCKAELSAFSVTWYFRNHSNMVTCCSRNIYYYYYYGNSCPVLYL